MGFPITQTPLSCKNALYPTKDRGRKIRGTTSNSAFSHKNTLTASDNAFRCIGRNPSSPTAIFRKATPGCIWARFPAALHHPAALWRERKCLLIPITVFLKAEVILTKIAKKVKNNYVRSISSALFRVVSVMTVPPMILASSRFLPSTSRGVTEV